MSNSLAGKVALVTGGGSGLGHAVVERFLNDGACVVVLERSSTLAAAMAENFQGRQLEVCVGDVRHADDNRRAVEAARARFGRLDIYVGNAGIYDNRASLEDLCLDSIDAAFDELFSINVKGYLMGVRACLDELKRNQGCVVFTASVSSYTAGYGGVLYVAAKHAIVGLVRQLAWELGRHGIRVNAVAPGYVPTGLSGVASLGQGRTSTGPQAENLPLGRICKPEEYAGLYALLASDAGRVSTGTVLEADGGLAMAGPSFKGWPPRTPAMS